MVSGVGGPEGPLSYRVEGMQAPQVTAQARELGRKIDDFTTQIRGFLSSPASADNNAALEKLATTIDGLGCMTGGR